MRVCGRCCNSCVLCAALAVQSLCAPCALAVYSCATARFCMVILLTNMLTRLSHAWRTYVWRTYVWRTRGVAVAWPWPWPWPWQTGTGDHQCQGSPERQVSARHMSRAPRFRPRAPRGLGGLLLGLLAVLVVVDVLPRAEAYSCSSDADCQYPGCNDFSCSGYESISACNNGVWDAVCVSIS